MFRLLAEVGFSKVARAARWPRNSSGLGATLVTKTCKAHRAAHICPTGSAPDDMLSLSGPKTDMYRSLERDQTHTLVVKLTVV